MNAKIIIFVIYPIYCLVGGTFVTLVAFYYGWWAMLAFVIVAGVGIFIMDTLFDWKVKK